MHPICYFVEISGSHGTHQFKLLSRFACKHIWKGFSQGCDTARVIGIILRIAWTIDFGASSLSSTERFKASMFMFCRISISTARPYHFIFSQIWSSASLSILNSRRILLENRSSWIWNWISPIQTVWRWNSEKAYVRCCAIAFGCCSRRWQCIGDEQLKT